MSDKDQDLLGVPKEAGPMVYGIIAAEVVALGVGAVVFGPAAAIVGGALVAKALLGSLWVAKKIKETKAS